METTSSDDLIEEAWAALTAEPGGARPQAAFPIISGPSGHLPSRFRVEDTAVASVSVALMAAAALKAPDPAVLALRLDRRHVAAAVRSERYFTRRGQSAGAGFAPLSRFWRTADGWVRTHANYPWHQAALLEALGTGGDPEAVARAAQERPSEVVETDVVAAGGVAAAVRSLDEWRAHPQGRAVAGEPLVGHRSVGTVAPRAGAVAGLPVAGVRILDLTRVIAGPVCTRYLGALGADVLRLDPPGHPDIRPGAMADTLLGKRSAELDFTDRRGSATLHELLDQADVLVCGYRPGSLERFGLGADDLAERHPGLVAVYLAAWGHSGPWARRRGFDSVVQAPTGIATAESDVDSTPGSLPCQLLDHGTGYLAAAAVLDGLRRQRHYGGTHIRRLSLARTAEWLTSAGAAKAAAAEVAPAGDSEPWIVEFGERHDSVSVVAPPGSLDGQPLTWPGPPASYRTDRAAWLA